MIFKQAIHRAIFWNSKEINEAIRSMKWHSLLHAIWKIRYKLVTLLGGKTVGVRALVISDTPKISGASTQKILLIRHTYSHGWYTIGGAVEVGETPTEGILRELREEVGITVLEPPSLMGVYYTNNQGREDYVMLYVVKKWKMLEGHSCAEIADKRWFLISELPPDVSPATQRRIEEFQGKREKTEKW